MTQTSGHAVQPVAIIQIALMPNGSVQCQSSAANRIMANAMLSTAMQDLAENYRDKEKGPQIEAAPPGLRIG